MGIGEGDVRILREVGIGSAVGEKEVPSGAVGMDDAQRMLARNGHGFHRFLVDGLPDGVSPDGAQKFCLVVGKGELVSVDLGRLVAFWTLLARLVGVIVPVVEVVFLVPDVLLAHLVDEGMSGGRVGQRPFALKRRHALNAKLCILGHQQALHLLVVEIKIRGTLPNSDV